MQPRTRYVKNGGRSIAYQVFGDGPLDLVVIPGFVSNVECDWDFPNLVRFLERLGAFARVIRWDKAGTGMSDPVDRVPTLDERVDDLMAVLGAAGCQRAALLGISEGGPMSLLFAGALPERTVALILYGSSPKFSAGPGWEWGWTEEQMARAKTDIDENWGSPAVLDLWAPGQIGNAAVAHAWGRRQRMGATPATASAVFEALCRLDCREVLSSVGAPTLILHAIGDRVADVRAARHMAATIPDARIVEFPSDDHIYFVLDPDPVADEIEAFLTGDRPEVRFDRILATVMFTDIVGSTSRAAELGDQRWRDLLASHHAIVRRELGRFDGREVKTIGDGFLATFAAPSRAIACGKAVRNSVRQLGIEVRVGLHTGECEVIGADVGGLAVHTGARVAALAGPGEVLVSSTVKDLVAGSRIDFEDRGAHKLKGVPGEWRLFAVN